MSEAVTLLLAQLQFAVAGRDPMYLLQCGLGFVVVAAFLSWLALEAVERR